MPEFREPVTIQPKKTGTAPAEELLRELEREKRARLEAVEEAEKHKRLAEVLNRMAKVMASEANLDILLQNLLEIFVDVTHVDFVVIRLREGNRLRSRASVGLTEEVAAGFSIPIDEGWTARMAAESGPILIPSPLTDSSADAGLTSPFIRKKDPKALYGIGLRDGDRVLGVVFMGTLKDHEFSGEEKQLLGAMATRATAAIIRHSTHEVLQKAVRSRDEMLAVIAHDLRNPVSVIAMAAQALMKRVPDISTRRPVERIVRAARRADRLIQDLLEVNAIEEGRFAIDARRLDITDVILAALESQQSLAASSSIIIAPDIMPDLPPARGDEVRLLEVLENLIGNAIKFTPAGGTVTVGAARQADVIEICVRDTGEGISPEQIPHLFDRFWQATKTDRRGTGLGLTICKAIVEAHGGRTRAESTQGMGTNISFTVPVASFSDGLQTEITEIANILLVDDRTENLMSLKAILERPEYRLITAGSGEEALGLALRTRFSVALIDVAMPGMNGLEVAVHLKELERSRDIPIIFITAFGDDPEEVHRAYSAGGADYLVKPLDPEIVRKKVAVFAALSRRRFGNEPQTVDGDEAPDGEYNGSDGNS